MAPDEPFFRKLRAFLEPSAEETAFIHRILARTQTSEAGQPLLREHEAHPASYVVLDGWSVRHKTLSDGRRQILNVILPGDLVGLEAHVIARASASVTTVTASLLAEFKPAATIRMLAEHPRLAASLLWATSREEAFLGERLLSLGRRPALDRVGHLFVELFHRLRLIGRANGESFHVPLNLDQIGDALGLSLVHVSRTLGRLRELNLVTRRNHTISLLDRRRLEERVEFPGLYVGRPLAEGEFLIRPRFDPHEIEGSL